MARLRTINKAYAAIKAADPDTDLSRHALRVAVIEGHIPSRLVGSRRLIDLDIVLRYFSGDDIQKGGRVDG